MASKSFQRPEWVPTVKDRLNTGSGSGLRATPLPTILRLYLGLKRRAENRENTDLVMSGIKKQ